MFRLMKKNNNNAANTTNLPTPVDKKLRDKETAIMWDHLKQAADTLCQYFANIDSRLLEQNRLLSDSITARNEDIMAIKTCFDIAADCQKQTSEFANRCLERHALYPAAFAMETLVDLIMQIKSRADTLIDDGHTDESFASVTHLIFDAAQIAKVQMEKLQIQSICPAEMDNLNSNQHLIVKVIPTDDENNHKKVQETLVPGLLYHEKVLRQAKVAVYRFSGNGAAEQNS